MTSMNEAEPTEAPAVEVVPIESLTPDAANVRRRGERAKKSLAASLKQFGPARSIVLDGKDIVRAGNGTLEAAQAAGCTEVLKVRAKPGQLVAVVRDDWSPSEATGYAIADNQLATLAEWNEEGLSEQLESLQSEGFDLDAIGFTEAEIGDLIGGDEPDLDPAEGQEEILPEGWMIVVECKTEQEQVALLERFQQEGLSCRAFVS
jgi:ParB-like chromosome segregation protein Spo0J